MSKAKQAGTNPIQSDDQEAFSRGNRYGDRLNQAFVSGVLARAYFNLDNWGSVTSGEIEQHLTEFDNIMATPGSYTLNATATTIGSLGGYDAGA